MHPHHSQPEAAHAVYNAHTSEAASMVLAAKQLVEVKNVHISLVWTGGQQSAERKAPHGLPLPDRRSGHRYSTRSSSLFERGGAGCDTHGGIRMLQRNSILEQK
ncbi:hypothetical protein EDB92DRAFT_1819444 [Lactarius akahatsu]|uniref:Uncharacterized protein n=1 Tax=Lactarius akahatsu TaxID=416441 RepID=A0AAD4L872_9AGAM|nr:hypothetical protein EDB92DRAFT_1819444 [Lactarius akahatsu]